MESVHSDLSDIVSDDDSGTLSGRKPRRSRAASCEISSSSGSSSDSSSSGSSSSDSSSSDSSIGSDRTSRTLPPSVKKVSSSIGVKKEYVKNVFDKIQVQHEGILVKGGSQTTKKYEYPILNISGDTSVDLHGPQLNDTPNSVEEDLTDYSRAIVPYIPERSPDEKKIHLASEIRSIIKRHRYKEYSSCLEASGNQWQLQQRNKDELKSKYGKTRTSSTHDQVVSVHRKIGNGKTLYLAWPKQGEAEPAHQKIKWDDGERNMNEAKLKRNEKKKSTIRRHNRHPPKLMTHETEKDIKSLAECASSSAGITLFKKTDVQMYPAKKKDIPVGRSPGSFTVSNVCTDNGSPSHEHQKSIEMSQCSNELKTNTSANEKSKAETSQRKRMKISEIFGEDLKIPKKKKFRPIQPNRHSSTIIMPNEVPTVEKFYEANMLLSKQMDKHSSSSINLIDVHPYEEGQRMFSPLRSINELLPFKVGSSESVDPNERPLTPGANLEGPALIDDQIIKPSLSSSVVGDRIIFNKPEYIEPKSVSGQLLPILLKRFEHIQKETHYAINQLQLLTDELLPMMKALQQQDENNKEKMSSFASLIHTQAEVIKAIKEEEVKESRVETLVMNAQKLVQSMKKTLSGDVKTDEFKVVTESIKSKDSGMNASDDESENGFESDAYSTCSAKQHQPKLNNRTGFVIPKPLKEIKCPIEFCQHVLSGWKQFGQHMKGHGFLRWRCTKEGCNGGSWEESRMLLHYKMNHPNDEVPKFSYTKIKK